MDSDTLEPIIGSLDEVRKIRNAVLRFFQYSMDDEFQFRLKLEPGDLMMIENTRLLHGRTEFQPHSGKRRLQVCYMDRGEVISYLQVCNRHFAIADGQAYDDDGKFLLHTHT